MIKGVGVAGTNDVELIEFFIHHHLRWALNPLWISILPMELEKYCNGILIIPISISSCQAEHGVPQLHRWLRLRATLNPLRIYHLFNPDEMMVLKPEQTIADVIINDTGTVNGFPRYNIVNPVSLDGLSDTLLHNLHKMYFHTPITTVNFPIQPEKEWIEWIKQPILQSSSSKGTGSHFIGRTLCHWTKSTYLTHFWKGFHITLPCDHLRTYDQ